MAWEAWVTLGVVVLIIYGLARNAAGPDVILLGGITLIMTIQALTGTDHLPSAARAMERFGNEGLLTVAALYVVTAGLTYTGAMSLIVQPILGRPATVRAAQVRMMLPVAGMSAFLNNTPIVAMFMPVISDWCKKYNLSPSRLFIPLSYASIAGGTCTLIGTSTNLVVYGMLSEDTKAHIGLFTVGLIGLPVALVVIAYVLLFSGKLLPDRKTARAELADPRRYTVEMLVEKGSAVDGKTIAEAGLRNLPGAYLMEVERDGDRIVAVGPEQVLRGGDRLIFVGVVASVVDLQRTRGLVPATNQVYKLSDPRPNRVLVEAVVSDTCPLIGKSIKQGEFRTVYDAAVIAVRRSGQNLTNIKIGDIVLQSGDTLLIETHPRFIKRQRNRRDFFLVSAVQDSQPIRHQKAWLALGILAAMVTLVTLEVLTMLNAALIAGGLMVVTRCCSGNEARQSVDWRVLVVIGAALGIGLSMDMSGAAGRIAEAFISIAQGHPWLVLLMVYLVTTMFTEMITNNAAAVLVVPIAKASALGMDVSVLPFVIAIMIGASASFATPIGYQTNLMVYGPGGYKFTDYVRIGLPLNLLVMTITVSLAPLIWAFTP
jgi:di/tricarboxylate transporter